MWDTPGMYEFFGWKLKFSQHYLGTNEQCIIESEYRFSEAEIGLIEIIVSRTVAQSLSALYFRSCAASPLHRQRDESGNNAHSYRSERCCGWKIRE
jgi:hypothetical protein